MPLGLDDAPTSVRRRASKGVNVPRVHDVVLVQNTTLSTIAVQVLAADQTVLRPRSHVRQPSSPPGLDASRGAEAPPLTHITYARSGDRSLVESSPCARPES